MQRGDIITLDGTSGEVMLGDIAKIEASSSDDFQVLLSWADKHRRLKVRANAETPEDAAKARELGAEGIGLCRTEHMFFEADRIDVMRAMILSEATRSAQKFLDQLGSSSTRHAGIVQGNGRPARHHPPAGSAAARVPAPDRRRHRRAV